jgi:maltose alpha-D-glucosyltransferase/alpha-amylase
MREHAGERLRELKDALPGLDERRKAIAMEVLARRDELLQPFDAFDALTHGGSRIRCHGDFHLGQVLVTEGDVVIIDFEGEPARPLAARRATASPLRDVAGMLRSFSYAALTGLGVATQTRPEDASRLAPWIELWETWVGAAFTRGYLAAARGAGILPDDARSFDAVLRAFVLDKALYELGYELNNRPEWVHIPLLGLLHPQATLHA